MMKKSDEIKLARLFLDHAYALVEGGEDTIYELLDPEDKYGSDLMQRLNNNTVQEILALGFKAKYGEDWHPTVKNERCTKMDTDYSEVGAVCRDCAKAAGFTPKEKAVGVWMDECGICHEQKPCTNLWHDWYKKPNNTKER